MVLPKGQQLAVQSSFKAVESNPDSFAAAFYGHLFEHDQSLRRLFKIDLKQQGDVLVRMLTLAVAGLDHPDDLEPMLHDLGLHHAGFGVKADDYETFGIALTQTLGELLGAQFTPDIAEAWAAFYKFLATGSIAGMHE